MTKHHENAENHSSKLDGEENAVWIEFASTNTVAAAVVILNRMLFRPPLFKLGQIVATPLALDVLDRAGINVNDLLVRHVQGDFGVICADDVAENRSAIALGNRIMSAYEVGHQNEMLWIITEHDRSVTTLMQPVEY
ncbi:MAG: putative type restriction-modification system methyltransferase subunit [Herbaspirillum sp.]|nr:putative type restriction-modification system methyltransferase subunit [Herbaspirillum sp.]